MIVMWIPLLNLPLRTGQSDSFKDPLISFIFGCKKKYIYELLQLIMASYSNLIPGSFISKMSFIFVPSCWMSLHKVFKCKPALWMYMFLSKTTLNPNWFLKPLPYYCTGHARVAYVCFVHDSSLLGRLQKRKIFSGPR